MVPAVLFGVGLSVACLVGLVARRWPEVEAPRLSDGQIVDGVERHRWLARHFRRHVDPATETGVALVAASAVVAAATIGIGLLMIMIRGRFGLAALDGRATRFGAAHTTEISAELLRSISRIGGTTGAVTIAIVACVGELLRKPDRALPAFMAAVVGGQVALSNLIKITVERARPDVLRLAGSAGTSFPSGHSATAAATLAAVALLTTRGRSRRTKQVASAAAAGVAAMVATTRVLLGVHWFTDVLAGLLLGWGWFALVSIAFGGRVLEFGVPIEAAEQTADATAGEAQSARALDSAN